MQGIAFKDTKAIIARDKELLHARLERLYFTPINSAIGFLNKGSRVLNYLWEGATLENAQAILSEIKWLTRTQESEINLLSINVSFQTVESSGAMACVVTISFEWTNDTTDSDELTFVKLI